MGEWALQYAYEFENLNLQMFDFFVDISAMTNMSDSHRKEV